MSVCDKESQKQQWRNRQTIVMLTDVRIRYRGYIYTLGCRDTINNVPVLGLNSVRIRRKERFTVQWTSSQQCGSRQATNCSTLLRPFVNRGAVTARFIGSHSVTSRVSCFLPSSRARVVSVAGGRATRRARLFHGKSRWCRVAPPK